jgi:hypothetical protein
MRAISVGPDLSRVIVRIEKRVGPPGRLPKLAVLILLWNCRSQRWLCWLMKAVVETAADALRTDGRPTTVAAMPSAPSVVRCSGRCREMLGQDTFTAQPLPD